MAKKVKEPVEPKAATDEKKEETITNVSIGDLGEGELTKTIPIELEKFADEANIAIKEIKETKEVEVVIGRDFAIKGGFKKETVQETNRLHHFGKLILKFRFFIHSIKRCYWYFLFRSRS